MKISKERLKTIIKEEVQNIMEGGAGSGQTLSPEEIRKREKQRKKSDQNRRRKISYMGGRDMVDLMSGHITEDPAEDGCVGNHNFGPDGRFTSPDKAATWSRRDKDCKKHGQYKKKYKGADVSDCGRGERKRCRDGELKYESRETTHEEYMDLLYKYEALQLEFEKLQKVNSKLQSQVKKSKPGGMDMDTCVRTINSIVQSTKGDFGKPSK